MKMTNRKGAKDAKIRKEFFFKILCVAADALGRQSEAIELANGAHLVAGITINHCMRADQGEAILVFRPENAHNCLRPLRQGLGSLKRNRKADYCGDLSR